MIYTIHVVTYTHYFPRTFQPSIDFSIMFMLNILWNNWWIWSNLVVTLKFLCQNMWNNTNKHSSGVSCSACNAFMLVVMKRHIFLSDCQFRSLILRTFLLKIFVQMVFQNIVVVGTTGYNLLLNWLVVFPAHYCFGTIHIRVERTA